MTEITPEFNEILQQKGGQPVLRREYDAHRINSFLQEAYSINARIADLTRELRAIRPAYLSTAPPPSRRRQLAPGSQDSPHDRSRPLTDAEREAIDAQAKQLLRQLNSAVAGLKQAEDVRNQTLDSVALSKRAKGGLGAIGRWAAGAAVTAKSPDEEREEQEREAVKVCRESVLAYLSRRLEQAGRVQTEMMDVRLSREVEKSKSALYKSRMGGQIPYAQDEDAPQPSSAMSKRKRQSQANASGFGSAGEEGEELSQEQQQVFAQENDEMVKHYNSQLSQLAEAEKSILEISQLQSTLMANIEIQAENIEQLVQDSYSTTENLGKGNKELKRASERRSTAQALFWGTVGFCSFLVVWDLVF